MKVRFKGWVECGVGVKRLCIQRGHSVVLGVDLKDTRGWRSHLSDHLPHPTLSARGFDPALPLCRPWLRPSEHSFLAKTPP